MSLITPEQAKVIRPVDLASIPQAANAQFATATVDGAPSVTLVLFDKTGVPYTHLAWTVQQWAQFTSALRDAVLGAVKNGAPRG